MTLSHSPAGPVSPVRETTLRPLPLTATVLTSGFLADLQHSNAAVSIPMGADNLRRQGAWDNFRDVAADTPVPTDPAGAYHGPCYEDGEAYKWLEAVAWETGRAGHSQPDSESEPRTDGRGWLREHTAEIAAAQAEDGYLNTFVQRGCRPVRYGGLDFDHEIFNNGAMIQSAVAQFRATGRTELLGVARRTADHLCREFGDGPGQRQGCCGHPVVEMALVELYRTTGVRRYLDQARYFIDVRGHGLLAGGDNHRATYLSDRIPVRLTTSPEGHAVRAIYLAAGATDVAIETGDDQLLATLEHQWEQMCASKMYVTGGLGSRWDGEAFGNPYELPSDVGYAETCAAIACLQWNWRLLLATGRSRYADLFEWQLYNAVLPGVSLDRTRFFYVNALQVRADSTDTDERAPSGGRRPWFGTSCCPTNLMRTVASLQAYVATCRADAVQLQQYGAGRISAELEGGPLVLTIDTDYPRDETIEITVEDAPHTPAAIELRVPAWADGASVTVQGAQQVVAAGEYASLRRQWSAGDRITLRLPLRPRLLHGHPRVEGIRGSVAIARGPILYAVEQVDQPAGFLVDDCALAGDRLTAVVDDRSLDGWAMIIADGVTIEPPPTLYPATEPTVGPAAPIRAVPYFQWGNRAVGPMKVWLPRLRLDRGASPCS